MTENNIKINRLLEIMRKLRDPDGGCPWDVEQTFESIAPYTIEEGYEVDEAIRAGDMDALKDELGDLLFQVVFHAQIADEQGLFDFKDVVAAVSDKMERRHPHVFAGATIADADAQTAAWEAQKAKERAAKAEQDGYQPSVLDGVTVSLPALLRAVKLQKRAARVGFDWPDARMILDKITEESLELSEAMANKADGSGSDAEILDEFGDLLFVYTNLARHMKIDPEEALRGTNAKFERRFKAIEAKLAEMGKTPAESDLQEMDALWNEVKAEEQK